jgi:hypothetical protein
MFHLDLFLDLPQASRQISSIFESNLRKKEKSIHERFRLPRHPLSILTPHDSNVQSTGKPIVDIAQFALTFRQQIDSNFDLVPARR